MLEEDISDSDAVEIEKDAQVKWNAKYEIKYGMKCETKYEMKYATKCKIWNKIHNGMRNMK